MNRRMSELKSCPFCGAIPTIRGIEHKWLECVLFGERNEHIEHAWWVSCETEHCPAYHMMVYETREKAIEAWNRRAES